MSDFSPPDFGLWPSVCRANPQVPIETAAICPARIGEQNASLRAVLDLDRAIAERAASKSADRWTRGVPLSPIDGAVVLVKANFAVAGLPWHAGIAAYRDRFATEDAPVVKRLLDAGAIILGLTNLDEGALGATGENSGLAPSAIRIALGGA